MIGFSIYKTSTGEIQRWGTTQDMDYEYVDVDGGEWISSAGAYPSRSHYFLDGVLTEYTPEQAAAKAARPEWRGHWSNTTMSWEAGLDVLRASKWREIKAARDAAISAPLQTESGVFDADPRSRAALSDSVSVLAAAGRRGKPRSTQFTLADNSSVWLSANEADDVLVALGDRTEAAHGIARTLRARIESATAEQLETIAWPPT